VQQQQQDVQKSWQVAMPDGIDFDTFLCLYVNHRPVAEVSLQQIEQAFSTLGAGTAAGECCTMQQQTCRKASSSSAMCMTCSAAAVMQCKADAGV
jgi:hypothetical protein